MNTSECRPGMAMQINQHVGQFPADGCLILRRQRCLYHVDTVDRFQKEIAVWKRWISGSVLVYTRNGKLRRNLQIIEPETLALQRRAVLVHIQLDDGRKRGLVERQPQRRIYHAALERFDPAASDAAAQPSGQHGLGLRRGEDQAG